MGALLVAGATSGAGKSTVTAALCRALARRGVDVAPFKAQNMSNHAAVTPDGGEIGRAQAMQALAARVATDRRMGPVLLKPSGGRSHVVVLGEKVAVDDAVGYGDRARALRPVVLDALTSLRREHELVVCEGAGGAAEPNLLDRDVVNLPLAAAAGMPALLVVDIDRGGAFAAAYGTWALLPDRLRACLRGVVLNGMRGDVSLLGPAVRDLEARTGIPVLGVLPHLGEHLMLGVEDSLDLRAPGRPGLGMGAGEKPDRPVRIGVVALPHLANPSDLDPLVLEPSVELRWVTRPGELHDLDLVVMPGTRATVADLRWLRGRGLAGAVMRAAADPAGPHVLGICGGYQMLGMEIEDNGVEDSGSEDGGLAGAAAGGDATGRVTVPGLDLLPVSTRFARPKVVRLATGQTAGPPGLPVTGYQIHLGRVRRHGDGEPWLTLLAPDPDDEQRGGQAARGEPEGCVSPDRRVRGTTVHGILDADDLRHALLGAVAAVHGRDFRPSPVPYAAALDAHLDHLADWVEEHLDVAAVRALAYTATSPDEAPGW
ncbi:cobyric acid synthase CobQ [Serinicoccus sp. CNJ-927]|uniref:cobyric acid synthase n=1 Tax=Serinicoccus sp. CNJ-927 TaxID=1904970 RepID=UPI00095C7900|nr:cobyric acid synthase [Serinicoccus sp. CNJ-927]OLT42788.1 cobyric acid synthase CobQ [Serinicoccus sp. CNJ-927]